MKPTVPEANPRSAQVLLIGEQGARLPGAFGLRAQVGEIDDALKLVASSGQVFHLRDLTSSLRAEHSVLIYKIAIGSAETCKINFMLVDPQCQVPGISSGRSR